MRQLAMWPILLLAVAVPFVGLRAGDPKEVKNKFALLVGVNKYKHTAMNGDKPLEYAEADVTELADLLEKSGYQVTVLTGKDATKEAINKAFAAVKKKGDADGVVLVAFAGHGVQFEKDDEAYFCPYDSEMRVSKTEKGETVLGGDGKPVIEPDPASCIKLTDIVNGFALCPAGNRILLADCCRNDPKTGRKTGRGVGSGLKNSALPDNKTAVLLSCKHGQIAWEDKEWKHGAFFYHVLAGLRAGKGTVAELNGYLAVEVPKAVKAITRGETQVPQPIFENNELSFNLLTTPTVVKKRVFTGSPTPLQAPFTKQEIEETRDHYTSDPKIPPELATRGGMKLVFIPPGEFEMGADEKPEELVKAFPAEFLSTFSHEESAKKTKIGEGFYMAETEVTVAEFRRFIKASGYKTDQESKRGTESPTDARSDLDDTTWANPGHEDWSDAHPVTHVTWNDAVKFCEWMTKTEGRKYRLPTQAEWEYACRAGTNTRYWVGNKPELLSKVANVPDGALREYERKQLKLADPKKQFPDANADGLVYVVSFYDPKKTQKYAAYTNIQAGAEIKCDIQKMSWGGEAFQGVEHSEKPVVANHLVRIRNSSALASVFITTTDPNVAETFTEIKPGESADVEYRSIGVSLAITSSDGYAGLAPVGKFKPNPFGLYDMHGNVWEYCQDTMTVNGKEKHVIRGGCFL